MEAEALLLPDKAPFDPTQLPPILKQPDSTETTQDQTTEPSPNDKTEAPVLKPTFKNILQAKKRLHAFSRSGSLPSSPKKLKIEEKNEDATPPVKKTTKKGNSHEDKAKAVIEEIEEMKREEEAFLKMHRMSTKRSRSRSRSTDKNKFKKVEKKSRNYRRRSSSIEKPKKKTKKYPKNWKEFNELEAGFNINRDLDVTPPSGNNDLLRQLDFNSPNIPIVSFKMKTANREEKVVPFEYIRFTRTKPVISYSVNSTAIKETFLTKKCVLEILQKDIVNNLENLYSNSIKFDNNKIDLKHKKSVSWYPKVWTEIENECKLFEKSVGLSFLQNYESDDDDNIDNVIEDKNGKLLRVKSGTEDKVKLKSDKHEEANKKKRKSHEESIEILDKKKKVNKEKKRLESRKHKKDKLKKKKDKKVKEKKHISKKLKDKKKKTKDKCEDEDKKIEEKVTKIKDSNEIDEKKEKRKKKLNHNEIDKKPKHDKVHKKNIEETEVSAKSKTKEDIECKGTEGKSNIIEDNSSKKEIIEDEKEESEVVKTKDNTPDTDDYHSHWESDEDVSTAPQRSLKLNRSWESDEELFERSQSQKKITAETYTNLEIPLNIKTFSRRKEEKPFSVIEELKLLEQERLSLSEERKRLELEKQRILKMQEEVKEDKKEIKLQTSTPDDGIKIKKELTDVSIDSLNNSLLSNVSSAESNYPIAALENEYEEFIKAVSSDTPKKKIERRDSTSSSSSTSSWSSDDSDHKKKKRKKKKKKKKKQRDCEGLLLGKSNIFNEFDIPVPSDLPEIVPTPVPVPSPIIPFNNILPVPTTEQSKPFVFPSIVLTPKKTPLVDNSNLKLDDDSDSNDFTEKFVSKSEEIINEKPTTKIIETVEEKPKDNDKEEIVNTQRESVVAEVPPIEKPEDKLPVPVMDSRPKKHHSPSPQRRVSKRRTRSRSRDRDSKRKSPIRRRDLSPPHRRRYRSPLRRSPRRRSPSPRRRRRRTPSISPPRSRANRRRTPSPRRRASPLNSPLDGFKRSVADSTISDDMLLSQLNREYSESPPLYKKAPPKRASPSPQMSPRRISLDDRINQVLGLEKNEPEPQPKHDMTYPNYNYNNAYMQYPYNQYGQKNDYIGNPFGPMMFTQPPPPVVKPVAPPTKVVQVGNILQVVPTEEIPPNLLENKVETGQKIVQVGNMLQIVPAVMPTVPETQPVNNNSSGSNNNNIAVQETQSVDSIIKQQIAERRAEREKRRQEREKRRKEKERKRKEKEKRKQMKLKLKTENMIKRAIQLEAEALANDEVEEGGENTEQPVQWPPIPVIVSTTPNSCKSILSQGGSSKQQRKSVQFADGVRPGEGTSPSGGEELSSPPPQPRKLPKEKRYKKIKIPKKTNKKKIRVKVVKKVANVEEDEDDDDEDDNLPPPSPPPGSPPPHVFPSRVKTHTINNVHQYVGNIMQSTAGFPFRPPVPIIMNRHPAPPYLTGPFPQDVNNIPQPTYQGVSSHH